MINAITHHRSSFIIILLSLPLAFPSPIPLNRD